MDAREEKLAEVIGEIQDLRNAGKSPDRDEYLARYPELAEDLESFLDCESFLEGALVGSVAAPEPPPTEEVERLDLKAFPIRRRLDDVSLGTVYLLSGVDREVQRELVVMRGWFTPREREAIERSAKFAARREGRGFLPILDVARLNHVPFVIRSHNRGPSLHTVLRALEDANGEATLADVRAGWASRLDAESERLEGRSAVALAGTPEHVADVARLFARWARVLAAAHRRGVWHLDVSPHTLQIDHRDEPVVQGVGLCWAGTGIAPERMRAWDPRWSAPEVCDPDRGVATWAADTWGFGLSLAAALSLAEPSCDGDPVAAVREIGAGRGDRLLDRLPPTVPGGLVDLVERCVAIEPRERPLDLGGVADELERVAARPGKRRFPWLGRS